MERVFQFVSYFRHTLIHRLLRHFETDLRDYSYTVKEILAKWHTVTCAYVSFLMQGIRRRDADGSPHEALRAPGALVGAGAGGRQRATQ